MALAFGRSLDQIDSQLFPGYGRRAKRVLFLSATPIEGSHEQLWNQFGCVRTRRTVLSSETTRCDR